MQDWKDDLDTYFTEQEDAKKDQKSEQDDFRKVTKRFMKNQVLPAFDELHKEFRRHKRELEIEAKKYWAVAIVKKKTHKEFVYEVLVSVDAGNLTVSKRVYSANKKGKLKLRVEGNIQNHKNSQLLSAVQKNDIIMDFLKHYKETARA